MFTFSFGSAFAADTYYASDYANAFQAEKTAQLGYLESDFNQIINAFSYDSDGYYKGYTKEAYQAAAKDVLESFDGLMDTVIRTEVDKVPAEGTAAAPVVSTLQSVVYTNVANGSWAAKTFAEIMNDKTLKTQAITDNAPALNKAQAGISEKALTDAIAAVDMSKYSTEGTDYTVDNVKVSAAEKVQSIIDAANKVISDNASKTDAEKVVAYKNALTTFKNGLKAVKTIEDSKIDDAEAAKDVAGAVNNYLQYGITTVYNANKLQEASGKYTLNANLKKAPFYDEKAGEVFGVKVADVDKITKTEAAAINDAFYAAIVKSADVVKKYAGTDKDKVFPLWNNDQATFLKTLGNAMQAADVYQDVVDLGTKYKNTYEFGVKVYDDEAVDKAVAKAEDLVYGDLNSTFRTAEQYLKAAAAELNVTLEAANFEYQKFIEAIADAKAKMYSDDACKTPAVKVSYGADKTPEEDLVYLRGTYDSSAYTDWAKIAKVAVDALDNAESYADIDAALAAAAADFGKLLTVKDATTVKDARAKYTKALTDYSNEQKKIMDPKNDTYTKGQFTAAVAEGKKLIAAANTVADVETAYADAQALVRSVKTDDELKAAKDALIKQINALPYKANLTIADKDTVKAAYDAYVEYVGLAGAKNTDITNEAILKEAYEKVMGLESKEINEKIDALEKEINKLNEYSDSDVAALAAKRAEIQALVDEADDFNDAIDDAKDTFRSFIVTYADNDTLAGYLESEAKIWDAELRTAEIAAVAAMNSSATAADMKAALDAYNTLTDRQKYAMDYSYIEMVKIISEKVVNSVETLKIKASSTAKKGSITVKWTVKGDKAAADGYQVYKSTKAQKGYKKAITTKKTSFKNTKNLKKGTRYYYKVRAYKVVDGKTYYSDWSNKANRIAK